MYNVLQIERELYEYIINEGKVIHKQSREPLDTSQGPEGAKWIFVMSTARRLYAGKVTWLHFKDLTSILTMLQKQSYIRSFSLWFRALYISLTWFICPEGERCISALKLFSWRCYHSCWKIYGGKWSDQGIVMFIFVKSLVDSSVF